MLKYLTAALRRIVTLTFVLALPWVAQAQSAGRDGLQCANPGSLLWKAETAGGDLYLFGSIHLGKAEFYPLHNEIEAALREAEYLVFEVDPAAAADPSLLLQLQQRGMLPAGQTLADHVSPMLVEELQQTLTEAGLPVENFLRMRPWMLSMVLSTLQATRLGYLPQFGIESYFLQRKAAATEILELEGIAQQMGFLESLDGEGYLAYALQSFREDRDGIETLIQAWRCADREALQQVLFEEFEATDPAWAEEMERLQALMFDERNQAMAETIKGYLSEGEGDYFVVVGAGHLVGEGSVVELLQAAGLPLRNLELP